MFFLFVVSMGADKFYALLSEGRGQLLFHLFLRGPALLVGRQAQITAGNEQYFICRRLYRHIVFLLANNLIRVPEIS